MTELAKKREVLVNTAKNVFLMYGVKKTTVDDIAQAAGMTKSSLYHYFSGKEELLRAVALSVLQSNLESYRRKLDSKGTLLDSLRGFIRDVIKRTQELHPRFVTSLEDTLELLPVLRDVFSKYLKDTFDLVRERLKLAIEQGEIEKLQVDEMASILMILVHHQTKIHCEPNHPLAAVGDLDTMLHLLLSPYMRNGDEAQITDTTA